MQRKVLMFSLAIVASLWVGQLAQACGGWRSARACYVVTPQCYVVAPCYYYAVPTCCDVCVAPCCGWSCCYSCGVCCERVIISGESATACQACRPTAVSPSDQASPAPSPKAAESEQQ